MFDGALVFRGPCGRASSTQINLKRLSGFAVSIHKKHPGTFKIFLSPSQLKMLLLSCGRPFLSDVHE
jgi:hypothetical protein